MGGVGEEGRKLSVGEGLLDEGHSPRQGDAVPLPLPVAGKTGDGPRPLRPGQTLVQVRSLSAGRFGDGIPQDRDGDGQRFEELRLVDGLGVAGTETGTDATDATALRAVPQGKGPFAVPRDALCGGQLGPKGRYVYLSWGCIEQKEGRLEEARKLFLRSAAASTRSAVLTD